MKYVALLSGGKDSCYNLVHCAHNGHELIAAASLRPADGKEELDSYLYQTVGQDAIELVAQALDVPLHRQTIIGQAVEQGSDYGGRTADTDGGVSGDETEDLYTLLSTVKSHHPDIQGVSVGAILSNYQRVRVEHVCRRLGLTSLAYLWQRDQAELLGEMIAAGMHAVLIKVAGIGLQPKHLGKTLAEMQSVLTSLNERYGLHVCGEGGEYESLTLDCPLFKKRIVLTETETVIHSDSDFATVAFLRVKQASLEDKLASSLDIPVPPLLDEEMVELQQAVEAEAVDPDASTTPKPRNSLEGMPLAPRGVQKRGPWIVIGGVEAPSPDTLSIEGEVHACFQQIQEHLAAYAAGLPDIAFVTLLLSDMAHFPAANTAYGALFGSSPPARACVAADLPAPARVRLEVLACADHELAEPSARRQALHVQGLSYWAPANIGPYSQAVRVVERAFISGQIGLIPSSMALPEPRKLATETALCFQHTHRIADALRASTGGGAWAGCAQLALYWLARPEDIAPVRVACLAAEEDDVPTLFLAVKSLPRGALVEKQVVLHTGRVLARNEDDEDAGDEPTWTECEPETWGQVIQSPSEEHEQAADCSSSALPGSSITVLCLRLGGADVLDHVRMRLPDDLLCVRVFHVGPWTSEYSSTIGGILGEAPEAALTAIPCRAIGSLSGENWDLALCITSL